MVAQPLKTENRTALHMFVGLQALILVGTLLEVDDLRADEFAGLAQGLAQPGLLGLGIPVLAIILTSLLPSERKASLLFWRWHYPLPGHRAFSELAERDSRVDLATLNSRYGPLPSDPVEQNRRWYKIFKQVEDRPSVSEAHRSFLLARDLASIGALVLALGVPTAMLVAPSLAIAGTYAGVTLLQFLLLSVAGRNLGNRLVTTAIAEASAREGSH